MKQFHAAKIVTNEIRPHYEDLSFAVVFHKYALGKTNNQNLKRYVDPFFAKKGVIITDCNTCNASQSS